MKVLLTNDRQPSLTAISVTVTVVQSSLNVPFPVHSCWMQERDVAIVCPTWMVCANGAVAAAVGTCFQKGSVFEEVGMDSLKNRWQLVDEEVVVMDPPWRALRVGRRGMRELEQRKVRRATLAGQGWLQQEAEYMISRQAEKQEEGGLATSDLGLCRQ